MYVIYTLGDSILLVWNQNKELLYFIFYGFTGFWIKVRLLTIILWYLLGSTFANFSNFSVMYNYCLNCFSCFFSLPGKFSPLVFHIVLSEMSPTQGYSTIIIPKWWGSNHRLNLTYINLTSIQHIFAKVFNKNLNFPDILEIRNKKWCCFHMDLQDSHERVSILKELSIIFLTWIVARGSAMNLERAIVAMATIRSN